MSTERDERVRQVMQELESRVLAHADDAITRAIDLGATTMRDLCVQKVKSAAKAHRELAEKFKGKAMGEMQSIRAEECDILANSLETVTLDPVEQEKAKAS